MVKLYYNELLLGEILTNHSVSIDDMLSILNIDMDKVAYENGWEDWEFDNLRMENN